MTPEMMILYWFGGLCALFLIICPLILLARIAADVRKMREKVDSIESTVGQFYYEKHRKND